MVYINERLALLDKFLQVFQEAGFASEPGRTAENWGSREVCPKRLDIKPG